MILIAGPGVAFAGPQPERTVLGQLARAVRTANLRTEPRDASPVACTIAAGQYLSVRYGTEWTPVVMKDGRTAYVRSDAIRLLAYQVTGPAPVAAKDKGDEIARFALAARGGKAQAHGKALDTGVGNGEFVALAYRSAGFLLPADPAAQAERGEPIRSYEDLEPGDRLYFWNEAAERIGEGAVYVGGGYVALADAQAGKVRVAYLDKALQVRAVAARRGGPKLP